MFRDHAPLSVRRLAESDHALPSVATRASAVR